MSVEKGKKKKRKQISRRKYNTEQLSEEELDPLPNLFNSGQNKDGGCSLTIVTEQGGVVSNGVVSEVGSLNHCGFGEAPDIIESSGANGSTEHYDLRRQNIDLVCDPEESYHNDDTDNDFDTEEEVEDQIILNEDDILESECVEEGPPPEYVLAEELGHLVRDITNIEPNEGDILARIDDSHYPLYIGQKWNTEEDARHYIRTHAIRQRF
ncbi:hypothetical protein ACHQM5_013727 [Ranunculus cassubicifolius]